MSHPESNPLSPSSLKIRLRSSLLRTTLNTALLKKDAGILLGCGVCMSLRGVTLGGVTTWQSHQVEAAPVSEAFDEINRKSL